MILHHSGWLRTFRVFVTHFISFGSLPLIAFDAVHTKFVLLTLFHAISFAAQASSIIVHSSYIVWCIISRSRKKNRNNKKCGTIFDDVEILTRALYSRFYCVHCMVYFELFPSLFHSLSLSHALRSLASSSASEHEHSKWIHKICIPLQHICSSHQKYTHPQCANVVPKWNDIFKLLVPISFAFSHISRLWLLFKSISSVYCQCFHFSCVSILFYSTSWQARSTHRARERVGESDIHTHRVFP